MSRNDKCWRIEATYPYRDENGLLLFEVVRYEPKHFQQRRPDGKGGWIWNLHGVRRVLYRLPELLAADPAQWVHVVEGEKDADAVRELGLVATTNPGGARRWHLVDDSPLRGRRVAVIADKDETGRQHAEDVARRLLGKAAEVRLLEMPGDEVKDVSDWIALQEGEKEEVARKLIGIVEATPEWTGSCEKAHSSGARREKLIEDVEPWPHGVDGSELATSIVDEIRRFVAFPPHAALTLVLWAIFTHVFEIFDVAPLLCLVSPVKRCGKTLALSVLQHLVRRPLFASNVTPASVFRVIQEHQPTLLVDEWDSFAKKNDELRCIVNSAHNRQSGFVLRCEGKDFHPRRFRTWTPIAIAGIGDLQDTIRDRGILIHMQRRACDEKVERFSHARSGRLTELARKIARWAADNTEDLKKADPEVPAGLSDRAADNWRPLLAIADLLGDVWSSSARAAAVALSGEGSIEDTSIQIRLLADVRDVFDARRVERISSADLCRALSEKEEAPWAEFCRGAPITPRRLANLLWPFGIMPRVVRDGSATFRGYQASDFRDAFKRYLPSICVPQSVTTSQPLEIKGYLDAENVTRHDNVTDQSKQKGASILTCYAVTDSKGGYGHEVDATQVENYLRMGQVLVCASRLLGEEILLVPDNYTKQDDEERVTYTLRELRLLSGLGGEELLAVHMIKEAMNGTVVERLKEDAISKLTREDHHGGKGKDVG